MAIFAEKNDVETETACDCGSDGGVPAVAMGCAGRDDHHCADLDSLSVD